MLNFFIFLGVYGQKDQNVKKYLDLNNKEFKGLGPSKFEDSSLNSKRRKRRNSKEGP